MMVSLVIVGVISIVGMVVIAVLETQRMDQNKPSLLSGLRSSADKSEKG